jgi:hypothetical protein
LGLVSLDGLELGQALLLGRIPDVEVWNQYERQRSNVVNFCYERATWTWHAISASLVEIEDRIAALDRSIELVIDFLWGLRYHVDEATSSTCRALAEPIADTADQEQKPSTDDPRRPWVAPREDHGIEDGQRTM